MIITIPKKNSKVVPVIPTPSVVAASLVTNNLSLGQLKTVDISQAEAGDALIFNGTKWQAESLDGGEFN